MIGWWWISSLSFAETMFIQGYLFADSHPVSNALVYCVETPDIKTFSNTDGDFRLSIESSCAELIIEHPDYESVRIETINHSNSIIIDLYPNTVGDIIIEDWKVHAQTGSTVYLNREDIHSIPIRTAEDTLRQVPGITLIQHGSEGKGHQFYIRGFDAVHGSDIEVTVEGIPLNEWSNVHAQGYLDLGLLGNQVLNGVWVSKGSFLAEQGLFGTAGSIDYQLGNPYQDSIDFHKGKTAVSVQYGNGYRKDINIVTSPSTNSEDFLALSYTDSDGIGMNRMLNRQTFQYRQYLLDQQPINIHVLALGNRSRFGLPTPIRYQDFQNDTIDLFDSYQDNLYGSSTRLLTALLLDGWLRSWQFRGHIYGSIRYLDLLENYTGYAVDATGDTRQQTESRLSEGSSLIAEREFSHGLFSIGVQQQWESITQIQDWVDRATQAEHGNFIQQMQRGWFSVRYRMHPTILVIPSAQFVQIKALNNITKSTVTPLVRITSEWQPNESIKWFASYGQGYRPLNHRNLLFSTGVTTYDANKDAISQPTITENRELGLSYRWRILSSQVAGFSTSVPSETIYDHVAGTSVETGQTKRLGIEWFLDISGRNSTVPLLKTWTIENSISWVDARYINNSSLPLIPRWNGFFKLAWQPSNFYLTATLLWRSPKPLNNAGAKGQGFLRNDFTLQYEPPAFSNIHLRLDVENVFNQHNYSGEYWYNSQWQESASQLPSIHVSPDFPRMIRCQVTWDP